MHDGMLEVDNAVHMRDSSDDDVLDHGPHDPYATQPQKRLIRVTFVADNGDETELCAVEGDSLMATAVDAGLDGIVGDCGGNMECATCHVYVEEAWLPCLADPTDVEDATLGETAAERRPTSRLSCQIQARPEIDGLVVRVPDRQY